MAIFNLSLTYRALLNVTGALIVGVTIRLFLKFYQARRRFAQLSKDGAVGLTLHFALVRLLIRSSQCCLIVSSGAISFRLSQSCLSYRRMLTLPMF